MGSHLMRLINIDHCNLSAGFDANCLHSLIIASILIICFVSLHYILQSRIARPLFFFQRSGTDARLYILHVYKIASLRSFKSFSSLLKNFVYYEHGHIRHLQYYNYFLRLELLLNVFCIYSRTSLFGFNLSRLSDITTGPRAQSLNEKHDTTTILSSYVYAQQQGFCTVALSVAPCANSQCAMRHTP